MATHMRGRVFVGQNSLLSIAGYMGNVFGLNF